MLGYESGLNNKQAVVFLAAFDNPKSKYAGIPTKVSNHAFSVPLPHVGLSFLTAPSKGAAP
jgi:hypothetical protein